MKVTHGKITITGTVDVVFMVICEQEDIADFTQKKIMAIDLVNEYAGHLRTAIGTNIPFQGDVYQLKQAEVIGYQSDAEPSAAKYPVLFAEAASRGMDIAAVAAEYAYNAQAWPVAIAQIEAMRMGAITAIKLAQSVAEIEAALAGLG